MALIAYTIYTIKNSILTIIYLRKVIKQMDRKKVQLFTTKSPRSILVLFICYYGKNNKHNRQ